MLLLSMTITTATHCNSHISSWIVKWRWCHSVKQKSDNCIMRFPSSMKEEAVSVTAHRKPLIRLTSSEPTEWQPTDGKPPESELRPASEREKETRKSTSSLYCTHEAEVGTADSGFVFFVFFPGAEQYAVSGTHWRARGEIILQENLTVQWKGNKKDLCQEKHHTYSM